MYAAEIFDGDILVVDKSVEAQHGHIVVVFVNGECLVKRLHKRGKRVALIAENPAYPPIDVTQEMEVVVWGVVIEQWRFQYNEVRPHSAQGYLTPAQYVQNQSGNDREAIRLT